MADLFATLKPTIEVLAKVLLGHEPSSLSMREVRDLLRKLDGLLRDESKAESEKAVEAMLAIRKVIDRAVALSPLAFLGDPISRVLGRTHEGLKAFIRTSIAQDLPKKSPVRYLRPD